MNNSIYYRKGVLRFNNKLKHIIGYIVWENLPVKNEQITVVKCINGVGELENNYYTYPISEISEKEKDIFFPIIYKNNPMLDDFYTEEENTKYIEEENAKYIEEENIKYIEEENIKYIEEENIKYIEKKNAKSQFPIKRTRMPLTYKITPPPQNINHRGEIL